MYKSYFRIGWRNLLKSKTYSIINIFGLAVGIASCFLIALYVSDELSYDRYHEKADRIQRIVTENSTKTWVKTPPALAPSLAASYPHLVAEAVRLWPLFSPAKVRHDDVVFIESGGVFADANVFSVFSWPMISGNPKKALTAQNSIVLTESMARKYFGTDDPIGGHLKFWGTDLTVTGIIKDVPPNSHLQFDFLISFPTLHKVMGDDLDENWGLPAFYTYVLQQKGISHHEIKSAVHHLFKTNRVDATILPVVQSLTSIHLHSQLEGEFRPGGNISYLYVLGTAAAFILLLACINFTNLTTAHATTRAREVGMRKVLGAMKRQLVEQFFGEALLTSLAALVIAVALIGLAIPAFNQLAGKTLTLQDLGDAKLVLGFLVVMLLIGFCAGAYPALFLSRFKPVNSLKGSGNLRTSNQLIRKGLIVFQFMISTVFLIGMSAVLLQLNYLQSKDLGFDREHVLVLDGDRFPQVRDALQEVAGIEHVAGVPQVLGGPLPSSPYRVEGAPIDSTNQMTYYGVTPDFVETLGMHLIAGRSLIERSEQDEQESFILNESAVRELGWNDPTDAIGKSFAMFVPPMNGGADVWQKGRVVGVVRDFNYNTLYKPVGPIVLFASYDINLTLVRVQQINQAVITALEKAWKKVNPDAPFNYYFLDDHLKQRYVAELKLGNMMSAATGLTVLIACLGLLGLVAFSANQRTKEIGIRKVMGASMGQIVALLSGDFIKLVGVAIIFSLPIAYFIMSAWLNNFAYHIELSWFIFLAASLVTLLIAMLTVSYQSIKTALTNPVNSLRSE